MNQSVVYKYKQQESKKPCAEQSQETRSEIATATMIGHLRKVNHSIAHLGDNTWLSARIVKFAYQKKAYVHHNTLWFYSPRCTALHCLGVFLYFQLAGSQLSSSLARDQTKSSPTVPNTFVVSPWTTTHCSVWRPILSEVPATRIPMIDQC